MPVPSTVADLDSVAANNFPTGSEPIGTSLDDYLRSHAAIIKQVYDASNSIDLASKTLTCTMSQLDTAISDGSGVYFDENDVMMLIQTLPVTKSAAATLTAADLRVGLLVASGTSYTLDIPSASVLDTVPVNASVNKAFDWTIINTASGSITVDPNTNTSFGSTSVASGTSATFRFRKTSSTPTYTIYRIS